MGTWRGAIAMYKKMRWWTQPDRQIEAFTQMPPLLGPAFSVAPIPPIGVPCWQCGALIHEPPARYEGLCVACYVARRPQMIAALGPVLGPLGSGLGSDLIRHLMQTADTAHTSWWPK